MRSGVLLDLLRCVDQLEADEAAKKSFRSLIRKIGIENGVKGIAYLERVEQGRALMAKNLSRSTAAARLQAFYGISKEQAYRYLRNIP